MLQKMRDGANSLAAKVLVGIIIVVMSLFGFGAFNLFATGDPDVASVNGDEISASELNREIERARQRIVAQLGENADPGAIDPSMLKASVLRGLINRMVLLDAAREMDLAVSDRLIDELVTQNEQFHIGGQFSPELYRNLLASNGHTPASFREDFRKSLKIVQLNSGVSQSGFLMEWELRRLAELLYQTRDIAYLEFSPAAFEDRVSVDAAEIEGYYDTNRADFMTEETVDLAYVVLSKSDLVDDVRDEVTDNEVRSLYETEKQAYTPGERRRLSHILLEVNDERSVEEARSLLEDLARRVAGGESFAELAREYSEDPGSAADGGKLGLVAKGALVPEFERVAWALEPGEVSEPVRTEFGVHLIRLEEIVANEYPAFEEVEEALELRLAQQRAEEAFQERTRTMDELAFESPGSLEPVAEALGLELHRASGISRARGEGPFSGERLRQAAFAPDVRLNGFNSPVVETGDGRAFVVRVTDRKEPVEQPLAEVEDDIRARLVAERARDAAREAADEALAALASGEGTATVAGRHDLEWKTHAAASRGLQGVPRAVLETAFALGRPEEGKVVGQAELADGGLAVVTVTRVVNGDYAALTNVKREALRRRLEGRSGEADYEALFASLEESASIERSGG